MPVIRSFPPLPQTSTWLDRPCHPRGWSGLLRRSVDDDAHGCYILCSPYAPHQDYSVEPCHQRSPAGIIGLVRWHGRLDGRDIICRSVAVNWTGRINFPFIRNLLTVYPSVRPVTPSRPAVRRSLIFRARPSTHPVIHLNSGGPDVIGRRPSVHGSSAAIEARGDVPHRRSIHLRRRTRLHNCVGRCQQDANLSRSTRRRRRRSRSTASRATWRPTKAQITSRTTPANLGHR